MSRYLAVLFCDLERHSVEWSRIPREEMVATISEYRYEAESLASLYGSVHREWAGDGHMFLFENADAAAQFGLRLLERWGARANGLRERHGVPHLPLRLGCHFAECTAIAGGDGWIGRGNAIAKRVETEAEPDTLYVTETLLDVIDLPLYRFERIGERALKGDFAPCRPLYRLLELDRQALAAKAPEELSAEDWFLRAVAMIGTSRENTEEEERCYRLALELRPDYPQARINLAIVLRARGLGAEAAHQYQDALLLRPDYPEAHYNYAILLAARGSVTGAREHLLEALRLRPDYVDAVHGYANLLAGAGELDDAAAQYERALELRPDYPEARSDYGVLLERLGQMELASRQYREALLLRPDYPEAHYNYALLLEGRGELEGAEDHYRAAVAAWPEYGEAHNNLAVLLHEQGHLDRARDHYEQALAARPDDPESHYNYALLLRALGEHGRAGRHLSIAHELAPEVPAFRSALEAPG